MTIMTINEETWKLVQQHLDYTNEEMDLFRSDPRNEDALSKTAAMLNKTTVVEVMDSQGCDSGHKIGDKFYFDGRGISLLTKKGPGRICILKDVPDKRPVEDILWTDEGYQEVFTRARLDVLKKYEPLAKENEPYEWINETRMAPWIIYVLKKGERA